VRTLRAYYARTTRCCRIAPDYAVDAAAKYVHHYYYEPPYAVYYNTRAAAMPLFSASRWPYAGARVAMLRASCRRCVAMLLR